MAITKVTSGLISADASSIDLNIDAGTLYLDVSENRVGIGTTSPTTPLQVGDFGDTARAATFHGGSILLDGGAASEIIIGDGNVAYMSIQTTDNATAMNIRNFSGSSDLVTIERASGNVGIGTSSPSALLDVTVGNAKTANAGVWANLGKTNESSNYQALQCQQVGGSSASERRYEFQTIEQGVANAGSIVFQPSGGNVGIGTSSPTSRLSVFGSGGVPVRWGDTSALGTLTYSGSDPIIQSNTGNTLFYQSSTEAMRIDSSGNLLVGTTSVAPATQDGFVLYPQGTLHVTRADDYVLYLNRRGSDGVLARMVNDGVVVGGINVSGSSTSYNTSSDYRLKENVNYDFTALDRVSQLKPARFNFIADADTTVDGFLAHEVQDIVPEAITGEKDGVDDKGNPDYQVIDQSKLVPLLTKAIQELSDKVDNQQTIINDLKTRIETLENA